MPNIYLIGYRGSGKSSVSEVLSSKTGQKIIHMDDELAGQLGDIGEFVKKNSWKEFRKKESELLRKLSSQTDIIVDCGGGIVEDQGNVDMMKPGKIIFLRASVESIRDRLKNDKIRPSLSGKDSIDEIEDVLRTRIRAYENAASLIIDTDEKSPEEVAKEILWDDVLGRIAVCINEETTEEALKRVAGNKNLAELRIDYIKDINEKNLEKLIKASRGRIIVTCRPLIEGGNFKGSEELRIGLLRKAISLGADYVDIEYSSRVNLDRKDSRTICSYHNFKKFPDDLEELYDKMSKKADIVKIACKALDFSDNLRLNHLKERAKRDKIGLIAIAMGEFGRASRIISLFSDDEIVGYASDSKIAPGQFSLDELKSIFMMVR